MLHRIRTVALLALGAATAACSADRSPTASEVTPPSVAPSLSLSKSDELRLKQWEQREKDRVDREKQASQRTYDSLKVVWNRDKDSFKRSSAPVILCDPLQYAADVKIMGPEGGDMSIGPHKLRIPRGALRQHTVITGEMPVSLAVGVKLSPHGTTFAQPVQLELSYKHCLLPPDYRESVAYTDDALNILEWPQSMDSKDGLVTGWLWHFSRYRVARRSGYATSW